MSLKSTLIGLIENTLNRIDDAANSMARRLNHPRKVTEQSHYVAFSGSNLSDVILCAMREGYQVSEFRRFPWYEEWDYKNSAEMMLTRKNPGNQPDIARIRSKSGTFSLYLPLSADREGQQLSLPFTSPLPTELKFPHLDFNVQDTLSVLEAASAQGYKVTRFFYAAGQGRAGLIITTT